MKKTWMGWLVLLALTGGALTGRGQDTRTQLPTGWYLSRAGTSIGFSSDLPLNIALSPDGTHAAVTNNGNGRQTVDLIDLRQGKVTASVPIGKSWLGLAYS